MRGEWTTGQVFLAGRAVKDPSQEGEPKSGGRLMGPEVGGKEIPASGTGKGKNKGRGQEMEDITGQ